MAYEKQAPDWSAAGIEPPESKRQTGWEVEDRPPAAWLNWFMNRTSESLKELQGKAAEKAWVEEAIEKFDPAIPVATLEAAGITKLSSATDSMAEDRAATPKAVRDAGVQSQAYTDQQIALVTETGIPKLVSYPLLVEATKDGQEEFEIPLDTFDANTDTLLISINRAVLDATQYTVTNTVRGEDGSVTQRAKLNLLSGLKTGSEVAMVVLKNVPFGPEGAINGAVLAEGSVPINRVNGLDAHLADYVKHPGIATTTNTGNDYAATLDPAPASYVTGMGLVITVNADSTAAATIDVNGLGSIPIKKANGNDVTNLKADGVYTLRYSAAAFILQGEGGEYGTAGANDVRSTETIGTENGIVNGTLVTRDAGGAVTVTPGTTAQTLQPGIYDSLITIDASPPTPMYVNTMPSQSVPGYGSVTISNFANGSRVIATVVNNGAAECAGSIRPINGNIVGRGTSYLSANIAPNNLSFSVTNGQSYSTTVAGNYLTI